jgi:hypothetical protein
MPTPNIDASAVTFDYDGRFAFQGKLLEVVFVLGDDQGRPTYRPT